MRPRWGVVLTVGRQAPRRETTLPPSPAHTPTLLRAVLLRLVHFLFQEAHIGLFVLHGCTRQPCRACTTMRNETPPEVLHSAPVAPLCSAPLAPFLLLYPCGTLGGLRSSDVPTFCLHTFYRSDSLCAGVLSPPRHAQNLNITEIILPLRGPGRKASIISIMFKFIASCSCSSGTASILPVHALKRTPYVWKPPFIYPHASPLYRSRSFIPRHPLRGFLGG